MKGMGQLNNQVSNNFARTAKGVHNDFKEYFSSVQGSVSWQVKVVNSIANAFVEQY